MNWQPIETAPKDGAEILLSNGKDVQQGWWMHDEGGTVEHRDLDGRWIGQDDREGYIGWWDISGGMQPDPTHWMPLPAAPTVGADGWYLQDTRSYVGNDVLWWAKDGKGYTTDVSKAHVFTREEAFSQAAMRGVDRAWPKSYIDGKTRPAVDMQYINHDAAIAAQSVKESP